MIVCCAHARSCLCRFFRRFYDAIVISEHAESVRDGDGCGTTSISIELAPSLLLSNNQCAHRILRGDQYSTIIALTKCIAI